MEISGIEIPEQVKPAGTIIGQIHVLSAANTVR